MNASQQIQAIVVDDHQLFRSGIVALLNNSENIKVVGEAAEGQEALQLLKYQKANVVILDLQMPGMNGLSTCQQIRKNYPGIFILMLSWHFNKEEIAPLLDAGAKGFLSKDCNKDELLSAIQVIAQGGSYLSQSIAAMVLSLHTKNGNKIEPQVFRDNLTEREREILACIANEYTNKEIANRLFISQRTVETHRRNLIQKLKVKTSVGLVKYYYQYHNNTPAQKTSINT